MEKQLNIAPSGEKKKLKVVWMSGGVSSFIAGLLAKDVDRWIYIHVSDQDPDTLRFVRDCQEYLGREITILQSQRYGSVEEVLRERNFTNSPHGAPCSSCLKRSVRKNWEKPFLAEGYELNYVWGYDLGEKRRAERMRETDKGKYRHEFPLIDRGLTKADAHSILSEIGIKRPLSYDLGFPNANCRGCCRSGQYTWNLVRKHYPDVFASRAKLERDIGQTFLKGKYLDELPADAGRKTQELDNIKLTVAGFMACAELGLYN